jgi:hypothetical protein
MEKSQSRNNICTLFGLGCKRERLFRGLSRGKLKNEGKP